MILTYDICQGGGEEEEEHSFPDGAVAVLGVCL